MDMIPLPYTSPYSSQDVLELTLPLSAFGQQLECRGGFSALFYLQHSDSIAITMQCRTLFCVVVIALHRQPRVTADDADRASGQAPTFLLYYFALCRRSLQVRQPR
jgi:hypothetical protein